MKTAHAIAQAAAAAPIAIVSPLSEAKTINLAAIRVPPAHSGG
jgi:hypothetical protein